jgi:hypothetical protein
MYGESNIKFFSDSFTIYHSHRVSSNKSSGGGGVLIAVSSRIPTFKRSYDLQLYEECVLVCQRNTFQRSGKKAVIVHILKKK